MHRDDARELEAHLYPQSYGDGHPGLGGERYEHLDALDDAGLLSMDKTFYESSGLIVVSITDAGMEALRRHRDQIAQAQLAELARLKGYEERALF